MIIQISIDDQTVARLKILARELDRSVEDLAESAVSETVLDSFRHRNDDPGRTVR